MKYMMLDLSAMRFLLVDDNPNMRMIVRQVLRTLGVRMIEESTNGADALEVLKVSAVDIIITDWMMQPMDGLEFTQQLRATGSPTPMIPIIMLSGFTEMKRINEARDIGVTEFLAKPISPKKLYDRIAEIITNPRQFVRAGDFFGPDRRRHDVEGYSGPQRRDDDIKAKSEGEERDDEWVLN